MTKSNIEDKMLTKYTITKINRYSFNAQVNTLADLTNRLEYNMYENDSEKEMITLVKDNLEKSIISYRLDLVDFLTLYRKESKFRYHILSVINVTMNNLLPLLTIGTVVYLLSLNKSLTELYNSIGQIAPNIIIGLFTISTVKIILELMKDLLNPSVYIKYEDRTLKRNLDYLIEKYCTSQVDNKVLTDIIKILGN